MSNSLLKCAAALFVAGSALAQSGISQADTPFYLHNGDKVVTYGDSITDQRLYTVDLEAFIQTRYPKLDITWVNSGWGGDTVNGGGGGDIETRISRDIIPYQPSVITIMLGMNDGGYKGFDQQRYDTYTTGMRHIVEEVAQKDPNVRFTLIKPSPWDDITYSPGFFFSSGSGGYNDTLARYSEAVGELATSIGAEVVDLNSTMNQMLATAKATNPDLSQKIIPGRVHPSPGGHVFMASRIVKVWGVQPLVSTVSLDAASNKVVGATNAKVSNLTSTSAISWTSLENSLPLPIDFKDDVTELVLTSSDIVQSLDQETLQVANLPLPSYDLKIDDDDLGTFTKDQLAAGINLATLDTPMLRQSMKVLQLAHQHTDIHWEVWRSVRFNNAHYDSPEVNAAVDKAADMLEKANRDTTDEERKTSQPVSHVFTLTPSS